MSRKIYYIFCCMIATIFFINCCKSKTLLTNSKLPPNFPDTHVNHNESNLQNLDQKYLVPIWKELQVNYGVIKGKDSITSFDGTVYKKRSWSSFESLFYHQALNEDIALKGIKLYKKYLKRYLINDEYLRLHFQGWLWENYSFVISDILGPIVLLSENKFLKDYMNNTKLRDSLVKFFSELHKLYSVDHYKTNSSIKKVMVLTSSAMGGGHFLPAQAIKRKLERIGLEVVLVDTRYIREKEDVMMKLTGKLHSEDILIKIMHAQGDRKKAELYWEINRGLLPYLSNNSLAFLQEKIISEKPDIIFSTLQHRHDLLTVTLGLKIPFYIVSTDYKLQTTIPTYIHKLDHNYVKILVTTTDRSFFKDLANSKWDEESWEYASQFRKNSVLFVNKEISWEEFRIRVKIFEPFGFPVREQMKPYSKKTIREVKKNLGIPSHSKVLMISMGYYASNATKEYVEKIIEFDDRLEENIHVVVSVGHNTDLEKYLLKLTSRNFKHLSFTIKGYLNSAKDMADLYNVSDLLFSKPGGGTTSEISCIGLPLISKKTYEWELDNLNFLIRHNLGFLVDDTDELVPEVMKKLSETSLGAKKNPLEKIDWSKNIEEILDL